MTDEQKLEFAEKVVKSGAKIGNFVMDNHGTMTLSANIGEDNSEEAAPVLGTKNSIMEYVNRLKPLVKDDFKKEYDEFWMQILELEEVKQQVYNKGKQQDTTFNRNLVARIIHQIGDKVYLMGINDQQYAEYLEPGKGKNHSVRQQLCLMPEAPVKRAIERFLEKE
ncbi:MAG: hypothetical protein IJ082_02400 [Prevotella sp.]|nr:hypothetical protein [Prevotella sp.]